MRGQTRAASLFNGKTEEQGRKVRHENRNLVSKYVKNETDMAPGLVGYRLQGVCFLSPGVASAGSCGLLGVTRS